MKTTVIISTYNWPWALERVLTGLTRQTCRDFDVVIGDDGSEPETRAMIERFSPTAPFEIRHVWHEDIGRRKSRAPTPTRSSSSIRTESRPRTWSSCTARCTHPTA